VSTPYFVEGGKETITLSRRVRDLIVKMVVGDISLPDLIIGVEGMERGEVPCKKRTR